MFGALILAASITFHPVTIRSMAKDNPAEWKAVHTHVEVEGWVTYKAREDDGDIHIRLCDSPTLKGMDRKHCIVLEVIPALPLPAPRIGEHIRARGIARFDAEMPGHHWFEVHPVLWMESVTP
jgi:hypothetical protein